MLRDLGFAVSEERFDYSGFPGRFATPIAGAVIGGTVVVCSALTLNGRLVAAVTVLLAGVVATTLFARWMLGDGVLAAPWLRSESRNLVASRGAGERRVWLVAHVDSKSQPVPSAVRVAGVTLLAAALVVTVVGLLLTLAGSMSRTLEWVGITAGVVGALPVMASVVGSRSDGAVDNASGVAAVLAAAGLVSPGTAIGVLLPSGEELGLAGARAWARQRSSGVALNCDGVDDGGTLVIMYNQSAPSRLVAAVQDAAHAAHAAGVRTRRMPLGLLTDSTALALAGWEAVTVSHGSLATLGRVHSSSDSLDHLRGTSIGMVADVLARAVEALAT